MDAAQGLKLIQTRLKPERLNTVQEIVFLGSWNAQRYQEIAQASGYDFDYLKEVGSDLWAILSRTLGRPVRKKTLRWVILEMETAGSGVSGSGASSARWSLSPVAGEQQFPSEALPLGSALYIDRPPLEQQACQEILKPGGFVRIRAPRKLGKTSLVLRMLEVAENRDMNVAVIDFQAVDQGLLQDLDRFLRWLCVNVARQLGVPNQLEQYWDADSGSKMSCHIYLQECILKAEDAPILLVLDEVNRLFEHPTLCQDFLPLLRSWHDEAARNPIWQKLRLTVVHSTELYVPLQLNQSPFNVGLPLELTDLTCDQVNQLAQRHQINLLPVELGQVFDLLEGHPYLTQLLFYRLKQPDQSLADILAIAATPNGVYKTHLKERLLQVQRDPALSEALTQVASSHEPIHLDAILAYRLESLGLIRWASDYTVTMRTPLYRTYFRAQLNCAPVLV
jgi:hypothetical protein